MSLPGQETRFRKIHIIEGTTPTPFGMVVIQLGDQPEMPLVTPRPTTGRQLDGGAMSANVVTFVEDPGVPFDPVDFTMTVTILPEQLDVLRAICNPFNDSPWTVGGDTWVTIPANAIGQRYDDTNTLQDCLLPADLWQRARMINVVSEHVVPAAHAPTGTSLITEAKGVVLSNLTEQANGQLMTATFNMMIYGSITPGLGAVPTYTASTPS